MIGGALKDKRMQLILRLGSCNDRTLSENGAQASYLALVDLRQESCSMKPQNRISQGILYPDVQASLPVIKSQHPMPRRRDSARLIRVHPLQEVTFGVSSSV